MEKQITEEIARDIEGKNWAAILQKITRIGVLSFMDLVNVMFGPRKIVICSWVGSLEPVVYGAKESVSQSAFLQYLIANNKSYFRTPELRKLFDSAYKQNLSPDEGWRVEILDRDFFSLPFSIMFAIWCPDILISREIREYPNVVRYDKPIQERDLLLHLEDQLRKGILTINGALKAITEEMSNESKKGNGKAMSLLWEALLSNAISAFNGIGRGAGVEYLYNAINSTMETEQRYDIEYLFYVVDTIDAVSCMKIEKGDAEGGIIFSIERQSYNQTDLEVRQFLSEGNEIETRVEKIRKCIDITDGVKTFLFIRDKKLIGVSNLRGRFEDVNCLVAKLIKGEKAQISFKNKILIEVDRKSFKQYYSQFTVFSIMAAVNYLKEEIGLFTVTDVKQIVDRIFEMISSCRARGKGCTMILGRMDKYLEVVNIKSGVLIEKISVQDDSQYEKNRILVNNMLTVDGAVIINEEFEVIAFSVILPIDEKADKPDPMHGARHNSVLALTSGKEDILGIVVSEDGPVSLIYNGKYFLRNRVE